MEWYSRIQSRIMKLKTLFLYLLLAVGVVPSYAVNDTGATQDSIKRVNVKIVVTQKPEELNFETLINGAAKEASNTERKRPKSVQKPTSSQSNVSAKTATSAGAQKPSLAVSKADKPAITKNKERLTTSNESKPLSKPNAATNNADQDHVEELEAVQQVNTDVADPAKNDLKASRAYLWVGFMLIVVGVILGILFGKTALLISIAGVVFVMIGYSITQV